MRTCRTFVESGRMIINLSQIAWLNQTDMAYSQFLRDLFAEGRVVAPAIGAFTDDELLAGDEVIAEYEPVHRLEMPGDAPRFVETAGRWAATRLFRACQFAVYRDLDEATLKNELEIPYEERVTVDVHYSVDFLFRYIPDLAKFAGAAAEQDPLLGVLRGWAREWPLSSVGMSGVDDIAIDGFEENGCLMQLYADRIVTTGDTSRLSCTSARNAVHRAFGMYPDLAPGLSAAFTQLLE